MINHSETLTDGIHQILFGIYKPDTVLVRYEQQLSDRDLCHHLNTFPDTPKSYTVLHESIQARWELYVHRYEEAFRDWLPPFYALPENQSGAFHILCDFYSSFIRAECRMIIQVSEARKKDLVISTLKFEALTLRNELLDLIREAAHRLKKHPSDTLSENLERYVLELLQNNLLITFFELQKRSAHLLENKIIPQRDLFLKHLKKPELRSTPWHRTTTLTKFELEGALRTPEIPAQLHSVENLLNSVRNKSSGLELLVENSISLLENVWFCLFMINQTGIWDAINLNNEDLCSQKIEEIHQVLYRNFSDDDRGAYDEIIRTVIHCLDQIQKVLIDRPSGRTSSAGRLIRSIKAHYEGGSDVISTAQTGSSESIVVREVPESSVLDQYIAVDQLKEKLGVSPKSLNHYLSTSKTPIHKFSNKTRLMHVTDFNAMMDHFKTTI